MAPGAHIVSLRVLGDDGSGVASDVIEAIDWAVENRRAYNIRIINLSLGAPVVQPYRDDPLCEAVQRAVAAGIVVVAAAGNHGRTPDGRSQYGAIMSPGNDPHVVTVGALDTKGTADRSDDAVAAFSSRGPTLYDLVLKPDVVAPGTRMVSAEATGSYLGRTYPERRVGGGEDGGYLRLSGTSMAAGVVSGVLALLLEGGEASPRDVKRVLEAASTFLPGV
jgi:serine protease AprX